MSLVARQLEQSGIATVVLGSAKDIMTYCGAPRFVFTDFPLGNPCGRPNDIESQQAIIGNAIQLLETADSAGESLNSNLEWESSASWKNKFMYVGPENIESLRLAGKERREKREAIRARQGR